MSNMSYCRFQNTLNDLRDCRNALSGGRGRLSQDEAEAAMSMLSVCKDVVEALEGSNINDLLEGDEEEDSK